MRIARTLLLTAAAAIAAMALTAATATAGHVGAGEFHPGETLEVQDEAGAHCGQVNLVGHDAQGGCHVTAHGTEISLIGHAFGFEQVDSTCDVDFEGNVDQHGEGYVDFTHFEENPNHPGDCLRVACAEPDGEMEPWPVHADEEGGEEYLTAEFCVERTDDHEDTDSCLVELPINEVAPHDYESGPFHTEREDGHPTEGRAVDHAGTTNCEIESSVGIEIIDTPIELVHPVA